LGKRTKIFASVARNIWEKGPKYSPVLPQLFGKRDQNIHKYVQKCLGKGTKIFTSMSRNVWKNGTKYSPVRPEMFGKRNKIIAKLPNTETHLGKNVALK
jgi:Fe-S cluster biosynthesis and repair protein YggX